MIKALEKGFVLLIEVASDELADAVADITDADASLDCDLSVMVG